MKENLGVIENDNISRNNLELANQFLLNLKTDNKSELTIKKYCHVLEKFMSDNPKNLHQITPNEIHDWLVTNYGMKKAATYNLSYRILSRFFNFLIEEGFIEKSPLKKRWKRKMPYYLPKYLTEVEIAKVKIVLDNMPLRDRALVNFFLSSGCRRGEVAGLTWNNLDLEKKVATVVGKGKKVREVDFDDATAFLLSKLKATQESKDSFVFLNRFGKQLSAHGMSMIAEKVGRKAQLSNNLFCHRFRHTYATCQLARGVELEEVRINLGHVYLSTTCIYASVIPDKLIESYKKIME